MDETALFEEVSSVDFLGFSFGGRSYQAQLTEAIAKTKVSYKKVRITNSPSQQLLGLEESDTGVFHKVMLRSSRK